jgi:5'-nucleotidase
VNNVKTIAKALAPVALVAAFAVATGCQNKPAGSADSNVTDLSTQTASAAPAPTPVPVAQPVYDSTPTASVSSTPIGGTGSYTVKRGVTLYSIARTHYGSGKDWQKIAAANPGLSPNTLKAGQTITLP